jgi:hydrogenase maturation protein HypF
MASVRRAILIRGTVQGVGFRPTIFRLARQLGLGGFVQNDREGVRIEVEGAPLVLDRFFEHIARALPPPARVEDLSAHTLTPKGERSFSIRDSDESLDPGVHALGGIPADLGPCPECIEELEDPRDRRFRYPFINCTACGPRYTIVRQLPYDRERTTMDQFTLCPRCKVEYGSPSDRRFHAEPNACPVCGPRLRLMVEGRTTMWGHEALMAGARVLWSGGIIALKGVGGYLLAADASNEGAVVRLREKKRRPDKPLAIMVRGLEEAERVAFVTPTAAALLSSPSRPIVLLPRRDDAPVSSMLAADSLEIGVLLPPTPLQHLLASEGPPFQAVTSGNISGAPIIRDDREAMQAFHGLADAILLHDRPIHARADDSVIRLVQHRPLTMRRARGFVPEAIPIPVDAPCVLALGGQYKNTVCLASRGRAVLSQHIGGLDRPAGFSFFKETIAHLVALFSEEPIAVSHDLHPDYRSTRFARELGLRTIAVQHHHAHVASCLAEHGRLGPVIGVVFDGTGYGTDGTIWGGEILRADLEGFERLGHLRAIPMVGGEAAIREPWRLALAVLREAGEPISVLAQIDDDRLRAVSDLFDRRTSLVPSTGAGRWFDAAGAILGLVDRISYDGQAAAKLETAAAEIEAEPFAFEIDGAPQGPMRIDLLPAIRGLVQARGDVPTAAARFHETMARAITAACRIARKTRGLESVVLSGGCFQNKRLAERTRALLEEDAFEVLTHCQVPPNDGGLALGQAAVTSQLLRNEAR